MNKVSFFHLKCGLCLKHTLSTFKIKYSNLSPFLTPNVGVSEFTMIGAMDETIAVVISGAVSRASCARSQWTRS